jgi:hypothetical protein
MKLMDDQSIKQKSSDGTQFEGPTLGLNGFPLNHPKCDISAQNGCIEEIDGGRFDLVGAYGVWSTLEVGVDFPFVVQESINYVGSANAENANLGDLLLYGKFKRQLSEHVAGAIGLEISAPTGSSSKFLGSGNRTQSVSLHALPVRSLRPRRASRLPAQRRRSAGCLQLERGGHRPRHVVVLAAL